MSTGELALFAGAGLVWSLSVLLYVTAVQPSLYLRVRLLPSAGLPLAIAVILAVPEVGWLALAAPLLGIAVFRWHRDANPPMWLCRLTDRDYRKPGRPPTSGRG